MIWISASKALPLLFAVFVISVLLKGSFLCHSEESFIDDHLWTFWRFPVRSSRDSDVLKSKDLSTLPLDELIGNLKVYEVVLENDSEASKVKKEKYKSLALKARKISSDEEELCSGSDEEYVMAVRDFKKLFRRRGKFVRQPHDDKKSFRKIKEEEKGKEDRRCFKCGDLIHFLTDCSKHSFNDQNAFVGVKVMKKRLQEG
ncbi:hypothetical protein Tco_0277513 [Tanacetum coccineum]